MRSTSILQALALVGVVPVALLSGMGCPNSTDCEKLGSCGPYDGPTSSGGGSGTGGSGGEGGQGGSGGSTPAECVPSEASDAVGSDCGVFVSTSLGDDANDGSRNKPFATVKKALETSSAAAKRIYVCSEGTPLSENLLVDRAVELYGGLDCGNGWVYDAQKPTRIATAAGLIPVRVKGVTGSVKLEDFDLAAADAVDAGGSSVGMFVATAMDVTLRRVSITAGAGKDGADPLLVPFTFPPKATLDGIDAMDLDPTADLGGLENVCTCPAGDTTTGGKGGDQMDAGQAGANGLPNHGGGMGGTVGVDCGAGSGKIGLAPATNGDLGLGAPLVGSIDPEDGWLPTAGAKGGDGKPGQGGGGGASPAMANGVGAGGGGACGGCGGKGGPGGQGGGASIALLVLDSGVIAEGGTWTASAAGAGGNGLAGQMGQSTIGTAGFQTDDGCTGGKGGPGAAGGPGGGGAGGVSAAIVFKGDAPVVPGTELVADDAVASGGNGGDASNGGVEGKSLTTLEL